MNWMIYLAKRKMQFYKYFSLEVW